MLNRQTRWQCRVLSDYTLLTKVSYQYRLEVLDQLAKHGINPKPMTQPELVKEFLNDLYRFELRRLRTRLVRGEILKRDYSGQVVSLRQRYGLVSLPTRFWTR